MGARRRVGVDTVELAALRAETGGQGDAPAVEMQPRGMTPERLQILVARAVGMIGLAVCLRAQVPPLKAEEVAELAAPVADLMSLYNVTDGLGDKLAAWLMLGVAVSQVSMPRMALVIARREAEPAPKPPQPDRPDDAPVPVAPVAPSENVPPVNPFSKEYRGENASA